MLSSLEQRTRYATVCRFPLFLVLASLAGASAALGQSVGPAFDVGGPAIQSLEAPSRLASSARLAPAAVLEPAAVGAHDQVEAITAWNLAGKLPVRNGFARPLPRAIEADVRSADTPAGVLSQIGIDGSLTWTARVRVEDGHRLRLRLTGVELPAGARLWVYAEDGETAGPFGAELRGDDGELWTPSVAGPTITLEARLPSAGARFIVAEVMEIFPLDASGAVRPIPAAANENCLVDARCINSTTYDQIEAVRHGIGHIQFVVGGSSFICTGGLLNDTVNGSFIPYFLTANHCLSTQASANTLQVFWDFYTATCGGNFPALGGLPKSNGSTLLATGTATDFTFLRLNSIPGNRTLLGWNANLSAVPNNTLLHRVSNPLGYAQAYSRTKIDTTPAGTCPGILTSNYIYSFKQQGASFPGSSGSPVLLPGGIVVGQLRGGCAQNPNEPCLFDNDDYFIDGRFSQTFPLITQFLNPVLDTTPCFRSATTACLVGNRFEVKVTYQNSSGSGAAQAMSFGGQRAENNETVFWFFTNATNFELGVKVLNACVLNNKFWVFIGGLTDQGFTVTVRDTVTGVSRTYSNVNGHLTETVADTGALGCP